MPISQVQFVYSRTPDTKGPHTGGSTSTFPEHLNSALNPADPKPKAAGDPVSGNDKEPESNKDPKNMRKPRRLRQSIAAAISTDMESARASVRTCSGFPEVQVSEVSPQLQVPSSATAIRLAASTGASDSARTSTLPMQPNTDFGRRTSLDARGREMAMSGDVLSSGKASSVPMKKIAAVSTTRIASSTDATSIEKQTPDDRIYSSPSNGLAENPNMAAATAENDESAVAAEQEQTLDAITGASSEQSELSLSGKFPVLFVTAIRTNSPLEALHSSSDAGKPSTESAAKTNTSSHLTRASRVSDDTANDNRPDQKVTESELSPVAHKISQQVTPLNATESTPAVNEQRRLPLTPEMPITATAPHQHAGDSGLRSAAEPHIATATESTISTVNEALVDKASEQSLPQLQSARLIDNATKTEMQVGLHTTEYGRIDIKTTMQDSAIGASIAVEHPALRDHIVSALPELRHSLSEQEIRFHSLTVGDFLSSTTSFTNSQQQHAQQQDSSAERLSRSLGSSRDSDESAKTHPDSTRAPQSLSSNSSTALNILV